MSCPPFFFGAPTAVANKIAGLFGGGIPELCSDMGRFAGGIGVAMLPATAARNPASLFALERDLGMAQSKAWRGRFPNLGEPNSILVRRGADGRVTHYQEYGPDGLPIKRVDITGDSHGGVPTPHVVTFVKHTNPRTGEVFIDKRRDVRPATDGELTSLD